MICNRCCKVGNFDLFTKNNKSKNGEKALCKECKSKANKIYRLNNKDKMSEYFKKKWRSDEDRRLKNKLINEKKRTGINASEYVKNKKCEICGMTNDEHLSKYSERLHIHHKDNNGRRNIRLGEKPIHENLQVLCRSCHVSEDNRNKARVKN